MSTQVKTEVSETAQTETKSKAEIAADAIMADATVVVDRKLQTCLTAVDNVQLKVGGKWAEVIDYVKATYNEDEKKHAAIVLKSIQSMGKTYTSAQSIRSYVFKMAKPENEELLNRLRRGEITVRASREAGRVRQSNPSKTIDAKFEDALDNASRYAGALNLELSDFLARAEKSFLNYGEASKKVEAAKAVSKK
jgi:hypothetical protein